MTLEIIKYLNFTPHLEEGITRNNSAVVIGNVFIGASTKLENNVVVRGDGKEINIGKDCILKERTTIHVAADFLGTKIGDNCIIGEYSIIHACNLDDNVLVGSNSVIMDGSEIGKNVIIEKNSLIPPGKKFESYSLIGGSPAKLIKKIDKKEYVKKKKQIYSSSK